MVSTARVYLACKITNLKAKDITAKTDAAIEAMNKWGLDPISPWSKEKHLYKPDEIVIASQKDLHEMWKADKEEVLSCHVLCDIDGHLFSRGSSVESGFMRFGVMRPTIFVDPAFVSIRTFEADFVAQSVEQAAYMIASKWATPWQRIKWRMQTVWNFRSVYKRIKRELESWR